MQACVGLSAKPSKCIIYLFRRPIMRTPICQRPDARLFAWRCCMQIWTDCGLWTRMLSYLFIVHV